MTAASQGGASGSAFFDLNGELEIQPISLPPADVTVTRQGKFFEIGEYPDKQFSLTEAEADAAIERFQGGPINIEHIPTLLDGKLGTVSRLWRQGRDVMAEYRIPTWLNRITGGQPIRISSEWDRIAKTPLGAAMVLEPRVADAVMMALNGAGAAPAGNREEKRMSLTARLAALLRGEGFEVKEKEPLAAAPTASTAAPPDLSAEFGVTDVQQMAAMLKEQQRVISELKAQFAVEQKRSEAERCHADLQELVRDGRMTAAEAEQWRHAAEEYPAAFTRILETLRQRPRLAQFRSSGSVRIVPGAEDPGSRLVAMARERMKQEGEKFEVAFSTICRDNAELAAAHAASSASYAAEEPAGKAVQR